MNLFRRALPFLVACALLLRFAGAAEPTAGQPLPPWQPDILDIHQINNGLGDSALFIFPDGTTLLLDAGAVLGRPRAASYDSPPRPNATKRGGEWIVDYIRRMHPQGAQASLDYAMLTHFHADHMGTLLPASPQSKNGAYRLAGITDVGDQIPIREMLDRGAPNYDYPVQQKSDMMDNYRAFLRAQAETRGLKSERFVAGRNDQIVLKRAPRDYPQFEVRNIAANAEIWTGQGTESRGRFPATERPDENSCSLAFRLRYGRFTYFNGGDMAGLVAANAPAWRDMESAVAWVVGPVDVHALNHHGTPDAVNAFFLSVLQPRVHIASIYAASQPGPEVMQRMLSDKLYPGPRDIFLTNGMWPGRQMNMIALYGPESAAWLEKKITEATGVDGHVVVRVAPGGERYQVIMLDDRNDWLAVKSVHGPYQSK